MAGISDMSSRKELILVCCHATYGGNGDGHDEAEWILQDFQRSDPATHKSGEHQTFLLHIHSGAMLTLQQPTNALLIFSGGRTTTSDRSEASSYAHILERLTATNSSIFPANVPHEIEEYATDSYQNLLFSIIRFRQLTGFYPDFITVITHAFKERRFLDLHAPAIKWPGSRIRVQGINPPFTREELLRTQDGELRRAYAAFDTDPYGVNSALAGKRIARNWKSDSVPAAFGRDLEAEVVDLLAWTGGDSGKELFPKPLPWEAD